MQQSTTIQLAVRGKPSAFDLSCNNEMCVVASPGCLTFFLLSGLGSPRHVIHYEQPQQIRQIRYQKHGHLAALRGGVVSLWDPSKSLRPLLGFVQSAGWITDLNWNSANHNVLATSSDSGGGISLWDMRAPSYSTLQISAGQVATSVDWCPSNPNVLAACCDSQNVFVWDVRMVNPSAAPGSSAGSKSDSLVSISSATGNILRCCWSGNEVPISKNSTSPVPSLVVGKANGSLEWWDVNGIKSSSVTNNNGSNPGQRSNNTIDTARTAILSPIHLDVSSFLLSAPSGKGVVVCSRRSNIGNQIKLNSKQCRGAPDNLNDSQTKRSLLSETPNSSDNGHYPLLGTSTDVRIDITMHGYPRAGLALKKAFSPPSEDPGTLFDEARPTVLGTCCESILGVRWGVAGRLVPPAHGGLELLLLTDSAALHVLRVSTDTLDRSSQDDKTQSMRAKAELGDLSGRESQMSVNTKPKYALKKSSATNNHIEPAYSAHPIAGKNSIPFRTSASEVEILHAATLSVNSAAGLGYEGDASKVEFWSLLQREVLGLEEGLQRGQMEGLSVSRVDQYARQVTLEVYQVNQVSCVVLCLCCVVLGCVVLCCVGLCCVVLCCVCVGLCLCWVVLGYVMLCCVVLGCVVLCCVVLGCVVLGCVVLCCVVFALCLCCVVLGCVVLGCVVLCCVCVVLCCVGLCCVVLCWAVLCWAVFVLCCDARCVVMLGVLCYVVLGCVVLGCVVL
jgi:hypothetical protein